MASRHEPSHSRASPCVVEVLAVRFAERVGQRLLGRLLHLKIDGEADIPARHRRLARNLPLLAAPFLLLVLAWGLVGARSPRGLGR